MGSKNKERVWASLLGGMAQGGVSSAIKVSEEKKKQDQLDAVASKKIDMLASLYKQGKTDIIKTLFDLDIDASPEVWEEGINKLSEVPSPQQEVAPPPESVGGQGVTGGKYDPKTGGVSLYYGQTPETVQLGISGQTFDVKPEKAAEILRRREETMMKQQTENRRAIGFLDKLVDDGKVTVGKGNKARDIVATTKAEAEQALLLYFPEADPNDPLIQNLLSKSDLRGASGYYSIQGRVQRKIEKTKKTLGINRPSLEDAMNEIE